jgi:hypothetical protein
MGDPYKTSHFIILTRPKNPNGSLFLLRRCYTDCNLVIQGNMHDRFILLTRCVVNPIGIEMDVGTSYCAIGLFVICSLMSSAQMEPEG